MFIYIPEFVLLYIVSILLFFALKKIGNKSNKKKMMAEVVVLVKLYNLDLKKVSYDNLCKVLFPILAFDLTLTVFFAVNLPLNIYIRIVIGIGILVLSTILTYRILGIYYAKKGMIKNV